MRDRFAGLTEDAYDRLITAAVVGVAHLADELECLSLSDEGDSLEDARRLQPYLAVLPVAARRVSERWRGDAA